MIIIVESVLCHDFNYESSNFEIYVTSRLVAKRQVINLAAQVVVLQPEVSLVRQKLQQDPIIGETLLKISNKSKSFIPKCDYPFTPEISYYATEFRPPSQVETVGLQKLKGPDKMPSQQTPSNHKTKKIFHKHSKFSPTKFLDLASLELFMGQ